ncbi:MAG: ECF transporter S component [Clostridia bacterium]|nr:ECF transporter S component [Clostridia bacterium]
MLAALACVATMVVQIPSPFKGYINLGDCVVLLSGWLLPPFYGFLAAGLGSALADIFAGYIIYAPITFLIKGLMSITAYYSFKKFSSRVLGGIAAECIMVFGYYAFEGVLYGFIPALVSLPVNAVQGVAGLILGLLLFNLFSKAKLF